MASGAMVSAAVTPGTAFVLGAQRTLFPATGLLRSDFHAQWAVSPDDSRFIFTRFFGELTVANPVPVQVIQVDNWLVELKAKGARRP